MVKKPKNPRIPSGIDYHGDSWRVRISRRGIKVNRSFHDFDEAVRFRDRTLSDIKGEDYRDRTEEKRTTLHDVLQRYLEDETPKKKGARAETNLIRAWQREEWAKLPIASIKSRHVTDWRDRQVKKGLAPSTIANPMNLLSSVFRIAKAEWSLNVENPVVGIARPKKRPGRVAVPDAELERLLVSTAEAGQARWLAPFIQVAGWTAMRQGEIRALRWSDIDFENHLIYVRAVLSGASKNGEAREVPMLDAVEEVLRRWLGNRQPSEGSWVFPSPLNEKQRLPQFTIVCGFRNLMQKVIDQAPQEKQPRAITFHDLRHWGCTRLAPLHDGPLDLAKTTGHRCLAILAIYFNPDPVARAARIRQKDSDLRGRQARRNERF